MADAVEPVQLKEHTLVGFTDYIREVEAALDETLRGHGPFLWSDASVDRAGRIRRGQAIAEWSTDERPAKVPDGLIHDWIGAAWIAGVTVAETLALIQNYDHHKDIYKPEVIDSKLVARKSDDFKIYLRLLKKKIVTVVLDTDHSVHYGSVDPSRRYCRSYTTRVAEVHDAGKPTEKVLAPDTGHGFLWRLNSYWRFQERDGGVYVQCRAVSLSRDVPAALRWVIEPIIKKLPRQSLIATLEATRRALSQGAPAPTAPRP
jgi:hypothetical protein